MALSKTLIFSPYNVLSVRSFQLANGEMLGDEPDPRELMRPFPAEPMRMWPISTRVNKPENDDASVVEPILATSAA